MQEQTCSCFLDVREGVFVILPKAPGATVYTQIPQLVESQGNFWVKQAWSDLLINLICILKTPPSLSIEKAQLHHVTSKDRKHIKDCIYFVDSVWLVTNQSLIANSQLCLVTCTVGTVYF